MYDNFFYFCLVYFTFSISYSVLPFSEKAMATHSSTLAWKILWTEKPGRLQSVGFLGGGHNWATSLSLFTFMHWRRKWQPTPVFLPGEARGRGAWWAAVYGVAQSRTWLKWLSSSSCCSMSCSNCCFLTAYRFLRRQVRWTGIPISWRIFHSLLWSI